MRTRDENISFAHTLAVVLAVSFTCCFCAEIKAQSAYQNDASTRSGASWGRFQSPKQDAPADPWKFQGRLHLEQGTSSGYIVLQVDLQPGHYIYSVSKNGSPAPTKIEIVENPAVAAQGQFSPNVPPLVIEKDPVFNRRIEKHKQQVQFFIPCQIDPNADFEATGMPMIEFNGQVCSEGGVCIPVRKQKIAVQFAGYFDRSEQSASQSNAPKGPFSSPRR